MCSFFHGTGVTPGHALLCGAGRFHGRHMLLIDILREAGPELRRPSHCRGKLTGAALASRGLHGPRRHARPAMAGGCSMQVVMAFRAACGLRIVLHLL